MKNILVTIDFEEKAILLVEKAVEIAEKFNSKVWIVHIAAPDPDFISYEPGPQYIRDSRAEELRKEHRIIQDFTQMLTDKGIDAEGLLIQGPTQEMILTESEKLNIDLIIIGHHEHGLLYKLFAGSVASQVINKSKIPVLTIPIH
jgi:nucleotide-binding universal stress UspA family protein